MTQSFQSLGGKARAARMSAEDRQAIARKGGCIFAHGLTERQRMDIGARLKDARRKAREARRGMLEGITQVCATINAAAGEWVIYRTGQTVACVRWELYDKAMGDALGVYERPMIENELLADVMVI